MGWVTDKGSIPRFDEGGKVDKETKTITDTRELGKDVEIIKKGKDKGKYKVTGRFDVPTSVVGGEGGGKRRQYEGVGVSKDLGWAATKAEFLAQDKMAFSPEDSLITTGKKKKLGKLKKRRKKKYDEGGKVDKYGDWTDTSRDMEDRIYSLWEFENRKPVPDPDTGELKGKTRTIMSDHEKESYTKKIKDMDSKRKKT